MKIISDNFLGHIAQPYAELVLNTITYHFIDMLMVYTNYLLQIKNNIKCTISSLVVCTCFLPGSKGV